MVNKVKGLQMNIMRRENKIKNNQMEILQII